MFLCELYQKCCQCMYISSQHQHQYAITVNLNTVCRNIYLKIILTVVENYEQSGVCSANKLHFSFPQYLNIVFDLMQLEFTYLKFLVPINTIEIAVVHHLNRKDKKVWFSCKSAQKKDKHLK